MYSEAAAKPSELIRHMQKHGFKLYECPYCNYGADNVSELLEHASAKHACIQPRLAYQRIIIKEGGTTKNVLRLVHLNQPNVVVRDISTNKCKKKSVREAERSIELEKLIGNATSMNESNLSSSNFTGVTGKLNTSEEILPESLTPPVEIPKHPVSNLQVSEMSLSNLDVPVYSSSSIQVQNPSSSTICLDNDEDNVIDLTKDIDTLPDTSEDLEPGDENKKLPPFLLYKCSECELCMKTASEFLSHVKDCINIEDYVLCAHCPSIIDRDHLKYIIPHYHMTHLKRHVDKNMCLKCPICTDKIYSSYEAAEKHFVIDHSLTRSQVMWKEQLLSEGGVSKSECVPITVVDNQEVTDKRKRSAGSKDKAIELLKKKKTCGRRDMIKLPINSTLDDCLYCALCEFSTKVKKDMEKHLQVHAEQQRVPEQYACSLCSYNHCKRQILEKHLFEKHKCGKIMRKKNSTPLPCTSTQAASAPTMDSES